MFKALRGVVLALAIAVCTPFAYAVDVCKHAVCRFADEYEGYGKAVDKFKAEMAVAFGGRTSEAGRANGLLKESNGYRIATMLKATGLPIEVGWRDATQTNS